MKESDLIFNLALTGADGKKVHFQFTQEGLRDLAMMALRAASSVPIPTTLERTLTLEESPIPANWFMVTRLEGDPTGGHVSIGIGPIDLQFAVSLGVLMQALDDLKKATEPDPTSYRRPN